MSDKTNYTADEFLSWLCWMWAQDGQHFYPPDETAWECVEAVIENYEENYDGQMLALKLREAYEWEKGQHSRAYTEAVSRFRDAARRQLDPIERAAREHRDLMKRSDSEIKPLDWSWLGDDEMFVASLGTMVSEHGSRTW